MKCSKLEKEPGNSGGLSVAEARDSKRYNVERPSSWGGPFWLRHGFAYFQKW